MKVTFEVLGLPAPQGSKSRMPNGAILEGKSAGERQRHGDWRTAISTAAHDIAAHADVDAPLTGPLVLDVLFRFTMPASRPKAIRAAGQTPKTTTPDLDKLVRSVGDALKIGGLIRDDSLFVEVHASKVEVIGWTGAIITVRTLDEQP